MRYATYKTFLGKTMFGGFSLLLPTGLHGSLGGSEWVMTLVPIRGWNAA